MYANNTLTCMNSCMKWSEIPQLLRPEEDEIRTSRGSNTKPHPSIGSNRCSDWLGWISCDHSVNHSTKLLPTDTVLVVVIFLRLRSCTRIRIRVYFFRYNIKVTCGGGTKKEPIFGLLFISPKMNFYSTYVGKTAHCTPIAKILWKLNWNWKIEFNVIIKRQPRRYGSTSLVRLWYPQWNRD